LSLSLLQFQETLEKAGLLNQFPPDSLPSLLLFSQKMLQWNENLNLTRWTKDEDFLIFHILDSAYVLPHLQTLATGPRNWVDLGTGCGFPGAVIAASHPDWNVTFLDSVAKKIKALEDCLEPTGWKGDTLIGRAEEVGQAPQTRESWDGVTARAVADWPVLLEYAIPLLKTGGYLVNWMTAGQQKDVDKAASIFQTLQCQIVKEAQYQLPGADLPRYLMIVEKLGKTPALYPRPVGIPSKKPL
jgi:16S rRNA (guanine527-N7)-methyltransferase